MIKHAAVYERGLVVNQTTKLLTALFIIQVIYQIPGTCSNCTSNNNSDTSMSSSVIQFAASIVFYCCLNDTTTLLCVCRCSSFYSCMPALFLIRKQVSALADNEETTTGKQRQNKYSYKIIIFHNSKKLFSAKFGVEKATDNGHSPTSNLCWL